MTDHITLPRSVVERLILGLEVAKSWIEISDQAHAAKFVDKYIEEGESVIKPISWVGWSSIEYAALAGAAQAEPVALTEEGQRLVDEELAKASDRRAAELASWKACEKAHTCPCFDRVGNQITNCWFAAAPTPPATTVPVLETLTDAEIAEPFKPFRTSASRAFIEGVRFAEAAHAAKLAKRGGV